MSACGTTKSKSNVDKIDQTDLWRMGQLQQVIAILVSIAIACAYAAAFAKNDLQSCRNTQEPANICNGSTIT